MRALPVRGEAVPDYSDPPDAWYQEARRGLYLYDWGHHGYHNSRRDQYERGAVPTNPITRDEIPEPHAEMLRLVRFESLRFADQLRINLDQLPPYAPAIPSDDD